jgi:heme exporter protein C
MLIIGAYLGLVWSPPDVDQHDAMRILYVHVPSVWTAYLGFFLVLVSSVMFLWKRDLMWDRLAAACAELGVLFTALTLAAGSIWAKPIWGTWWTWDARLTTTLILWLIYLAYLVVRAYAGEPGRAARYAAVIGIIGFLDVPIIRQSVVWWRTLHPGPTVVQESGGTGLTGPMLVTLAVSFVAFTLLSVYLILQKVRIEQAKDELAGRRMVDWS